jgi:hypothetical protein
MAAIDPMAPIDPVATVTHGAPSSGSPSIGFPSPGALPMGGFPIGSPAGFAPGSGNTSGLPLGTSFSQHDSATDSGQAGGVQIGERSPASSVSQRSRRSSGSPLTWVTGAAISLVIVAVVWLAIRQEQEAVEVANQSPSTATKGPPIDDLDIRNQRPPATKTKKQRPEPAPEDLPARPNPNPMPQPPQLVPPPEAMPTDPVMVNKPVEPPPMPKPPQPAPEPKPEEMPLPPRGEVTALAKALITAKAALIDGNLEEAKAQLAQAETLAKLPEHKAMVERLRTLDNYVGQFYHAIDEAVKSFQSGTEIEVGNTVVVVVEVLPDNLILRVAGMNKRYARNELPAGLAVAIANKWLDQSDPIAKVVNGAYLAVARINADERARALWEEAARAGEPTQNLMLVLDDHYNEIEAKFDQLARERARAKP